MRPRRHSVLALCGLCFLSLGASCDSKQEVTSVPAAAAAAEPAEPSSADRIEALPEVDVSQLTSAEVKIWVALVNEELSPCGEPVSVARCVEAEAGCGACVTAARYLARLVTEGYGQPEIATQYQARFGKAPKLEPKIEGAPVRGAPMAPVTIVEFSDFQCPYCGRAHPLLSRALAELDGKVKLIFKHYPLGSHPRAMPAALAAVAAQRQGKFWEMHDLLFEHQADLSDEAILGFAKQLGLDVDQFQTDIAAPETRAQIEADRAEGARLGVDSTPTIIVNGRRFTEGPRTLSAYLREAVEL